MWGLDISQKISRFTKIRIYEFGHDFGLWTTFPIQDKGYRYLFQFSVDIWRCLGNTLIWVFHWKPLKSSQFINVCAFMSISPDIDQQDAGEHCASTGKCWAKRYSISNISDVQYSSAMLKTQMTWLWLCSRESILICQWRQANYSIMYTVWRPIADIQKHSKRANSLVLIFLGAVIIFGILRYGAF